MDLPFSAFGISDIAVDTNAMAWYATGENVNNVFKVDTIFKFNSDLSILERYPLNRTICGLVLMGQLF